jgi:hypothetical protein
MCPRRLGWRRPPSKAAPVTRTAATRDSDSTRRPGGALLARTRSGCSAQQLLSAARRESRSADMRVAKRKQGRAPPLTWSGNSPKARIRRTIASVSGRNLKHTIGSATFQCPEIRPPGRSSGARPRSVPTRSAYAVGRLRRPRSARPDVVAKVVADAERFTNHGAGGAGAESEGYRVCGIGRRESCLRVGVGVFGWHGVRVAAHVGRQQVRTVPTWLCW